VHVTGGDERPRGPLVPTWVAIGIGTALASVVYGPLSRVLHDAMQPEPPSPYDYELAGGEVREVHGIDGPYRLTLPATGWRAFGADYVALEAPLADQWLRRSDVHAELMIVVRQVDFQTPTFDALERDAIEELESLGFSVEREETWSVAHGGRALVGTGTVPELPPTKLVLGFWIAGEHAYRVLLTVPPENWPDFAAEARTILDAFDPGG
jgi:hypothetical protein